MMMIELSFLDRLRMLVPARWRGRWYAAATALGPALVAWGVVGDHAAAAIAGVAGAAVTLLFAMLHSTSDLRTAGYGLAAAVTVLASMWGWGRPEQWEALLGMLAAVLGTAGAAAATPGGLDARGGGAAAAPPEGR